MSENETTNSRNKKNMKSGLGCVIGKNDGFSNRGFVLIKSQSKGQSMMNMVSLNLIILKGHILKQDLFGYWFLEQVIDMAMEEHIKRANGVALPVPMELIDIFNTAEEKLKVRRSTIASTRIYTRVYVGLWSRLYRYLCQLFDYSLAEKIFVEAYNQLAKKKYSSVLKVEYISRLNA